MSEPDPRKDPTEFLAATDALIEAVMEARSEYRDGASSLADLRFTMDVAISDWHAIAWLSKFNPYLCA